MRAFRGVVGFSVISAPLFFLLVFVLLDSFGSVDATNLCKYYCSFGKGGRLCHCEGRHFSGKRSPRPFSVMDQIIAKIAKNDNYKNQFNNDALDWFSLRQQMLQKTQRRSSQDDQWLLRGCDTYSKRPIKPLQMLQRILQRLKKNYDC